MHNTNNKQYIILIKRFLKIIGVQNQLPISFGTALACSKTMIIYMYFIHTKSDKKNSLLKSDV